MKKIFVLMVLVALASSVYAQGFYMEGGRIESTAVENLSEVQYFDIGLSFDVFNCVLINTSSTSFFTGFEDTENIGNALLIGFDFVFDIALYEKFNNVTFTLGYSYTYGSSNTFDTLVVKTMNIVEEFDSFNNLYFRMDISF